MNDPDTTYYRTRAAQEIGFAINANHAEARRRHKQLAAAYLQLLEDPACTYRPREEASAE